MRPVGHAMAQEPHPMHLFGLMCSCLLSAKPGSSQVGWIAFLTHAPTQRMSLMHRSEITRARDMLPIPR